MLDETKERIQAEAVRNNFRDANAYCLDKEIKKAKEMAQ
jgi:hypothetical protein